jgi:hypothetical protein
MGLEVYVKISTNSLAGEDAVMKSDPPRVRTPTARGHQVRDARTERNLQNRRIAHSPSNADGTPGQWPLVNGGRDVDENLRTE